MHHLLRWVTYKEKYGRKDRGGFFHTRTGLAEEMGCVMWGLKLEPEIG